MHHADDELYGCPDDVDLINDENININNHFDNNPGS